MPAHKMMTPAELAAAAGDTRDGRNRFYSAIDPARRAALESLLLPVDHPDLWSDERLEEMLTRRCEDGDARRAGKRPQAEHTRAALRVRELLEYRAALPRHPDGTIDTYRDALERLQTSVDGPKGHVLVTRADRYDRTPFLVWHSDSLGTLISTTDRRRAFKTACVAAGLDPATLEFPQR